MLPINRWYMPARAVFADVARRLLNASPVVQFALLGDDVAVAQRKIDGLAVFLAAYDYATASRRSIALLAALPQLRALPPATDDDDRDVPNIETVLYLRYLAYSMDIDSLADEDAVDLQLERDWCDYWYWWHSSKIDAS